jgi:hypothetical protein
MGLNFDELNSGDLHEKHVVTTWNSRTISGTEKTCVEAEHFPDAR